MEMKTGTVPLAILAAAFALIQLWWIGMTIKNGRQAEEAVKKRRSEKIEDQKERLEKLLRK